MKKIAFLLALILALLPMAALAADGTALVTLEGVDYNMTYAGAELKDDGLSVMVGCDALPISGGQAKLPALAAVDIAGERLTPHGANLNIVGGEVVFEFLFDVNALPDAVWLYPGGDESAAVLIWGEGQEAAPANGEAVTVEETQDGFRIVTFGHYEQDNNPSNGAEPIEWLVLEDDGETSTLISRYALDAVPFNTDYHTAVTWETSTLRRWLNGKFMNMAFTEEEQARLAMTHNAAEANPKYDTDPGSDTWDRVYLLSIGEAERYFETDLSRGAVRTTYAKARGADTWTDSPFGWWWLRSPGDAADTIAMVSYDGSVSLYGSDAWADMRAIRPVVRLRNAELTGEPAVKRDAESYPVDGIVNFGHYEQDNDLENGAEPIQWIVLANDWDTATLISLYALEQKPYNEDAADVTWEDCTLRQWLNDDFLNAAFSADEQAMLATVTVTADVNPEYESRDPGNDTQDRVFALSVPEAEAWFVSNHMRVCDATEYVAANTIITVGDYECSWWLRTPGYTQDYAAEVDFHGDVEERGNNVDSGLDGVRPVIVLQMTNEGPRPTPSPEPTPVPTPTPEPYPTLQKGAKGEEVKKLQRALIDGGWLSGGADGDFGNKTDAAVRVAQEVFGLEINGIADDAFQRQLYGE